MINSTVHVLYSTIQTVLHTTVPVSFLVYNHGTTIQVLYSTFTFKGTTVKVV